MIRLCSVLFLVAFSVPPIAASSELEAQVPDPLRPWIPWVLGDHDPRACPWTLGGGERICAWPGQLDLDLDRSGGRFAQHWRVYAETWVPLPGDAGSWPQDALLDGEPVAVVPKEGVPSVKLAPGEHDLSGRFRWGARPEGLQVPLAAGVVSLRLDGRVVEFPRLERDGRLWLGEEAGVGSVTGQDSLALEVYRRIEDAVPLRVITRLELEVAGRTRELALGPVLLAGGVPLGLTSELPARLEPDGRLRLQARPGRWLVEVGERYSEPVEGLGLDPSDPPWPPQEVWVFSAHPELRQVELTGADPVDPRQTRLPPDWAQLPAYLMRPGAELRMNQVQRGDARPVPDRLSLSRELWLDFGGGGYTLRDQISGELTRSWRLEVGPPIALGQVIVDGEPRFITRVGDGGGEGVEVRQGRLALTADGRIEGGLSELPTSGWSPQPQSVEARLHLPPGWDLLAAGGVDNLPDSWVNRWTLLDLFLVLIISLAIARLWGLAWGGVALITLVLIWQEPSAPRIVWLNLLGSYALLRLLPSEPERAVLARARGLLRLYYRASLLVLALIALPFLVDQVRTGIYPQLERPWQVLAEGGERFDAAMSAPEAAMDARETMAAAAGLARAKAPPQEATPASSPPLPVIDPDARVQTGPGVPSWRWRTLDLAWHGPVPPDHSFALWLLSPSVGLALDAARLVLVLLLGLKIAGLLGAVLRRAPPAAVVMIAAGLAVQPPSSNAGDFPSPELLDALKGRLLEAPDCRPTCADIAHMLVATEGDWLTLELWLDASEAVAVPVPGGTDGWVPRDSSLDGAPLDGLRQDDRGGFLVPVAAGRHRLRLSGPLPPRSEVELPLPLRPRSIEPGGGPWRVEGVDRDGRVLPLLRLLRTDPRTEGEDELAPSEIPPLLEVARTLYLGVDWRVETEIARLSPPESPVAATVPLIPGERVLSEDMEVREGRVLVQLPPGQRRTAWTSTLDPVDVLTLRASNDNHLSEAWRVEASPLWHLETEGIAPVHHLGRLDRWVPSWRPWPGEELRLLVSSPAGVPGPTLTLDRSQYRLVPGRRHTEAVLDLTLRSSQGGRHTIELPEGAELASVHLDGAERPLRLDGRTLTLPLEPGTRRWEVRWRQPEPIALRYAPPVPDVGLPGVNASVRLEPPPDRWVLLVGGPEMGPAVLFWGLVLVLVPVAFGLARSRLTPLKGGDWLLLGVGLSQAGIGVGLLVAGWLLALGLRSRLDRDLPPWRFNLMQAGLALLGLAALSALIAAVHQGLLGAPQMQIAGNGSTAASLQWYKDRSLPELPPVWLVSVPVLVYRGLMLAWALWLAIRLLSWLSWGWRSVSRPVLWRETGFKLPARRREAATGASS